MKGIEEDLAALEGLLRRLEHEYEQFFSGKTRIEPQRTDSTVQSVIKTYSGRAIQNPGLRFRYMNLVARYNSFRKVWDRKVREREEGRVFGRPHRGAPPPVQPKATALASHRRDFVTVDLNEDKKCMVELFQSYKQLRSECGESVERLRLESFTRVLSEKVNKMKESQKCQKVEIRLRREKDKTRILVRPTRSSG